MANKYYYVKNPTTSDKTNSLQGVDSPYIKNGSDEIWLLSTDSDYVFSNGQEEYHQPEIDEFVGEKRDELNKYADEFSLKELKKLGNNIIHNFWHTNHDVPVKIAKIHILLIGVFSMLKEGQLSSARAYLVSISPTTEFIVLKKNALLADIDIELDKYTWLKDTEIF